MSDDTMNPAHETAVCPICKERRAKAEPSPAQQPWTCKARAVSMDPPQDCDWPTCGCDPHADKVIEALQESGLLREEPSPAQSDAVELRQENMALRDATVNNARLVVGGDPNCFSLYVFVEGGYRLLCADNGEFVASARQYAEEQCDNVREVTKLEEVAAWVRDAATAPRRKPLAANALRRLESALAAEKERADKAEAELADLKPRVHRMIQGEDETEQILAQGIGGYPWFKDDQLNFPGSTEKDGVCIGEHVKETLAMEAVRTIKELRERADRLEKERDEAREDNERLKGYMTPDQKEQDGMFKDAVRRLGAANAALRQRDVLIGKLVEALEKQQQQNIEFVNSTPAEKWVAGHARLLDSIIAIGRRVLAEARAIKGGVK